MEHKNIGFQYPFFHNGINEVGASIIFVCHGDNDCSVAYRGWCWCLHFHTCISEMVALFQTKENVYKLEVQYNEIKMSVILCDGWSRQATSWI